MPVTTCRANNPNNSLANRFRPVSASVAPSPAPAAAAPSPAPVAAAPAPAATAQVAAAEELEKEILASAEAPATTVEA